MQVLWLTPDKPDDISVGRQRIAAHLQERGIEVTLRGTTPATVWKSLQELRNYDVVVGTTRAGAIAGTLLHEIGDVPFVVDHIDPIRQFAETNPAPIAAVVRILENLAFRRADHVLYVYEEEEERVRRHADAATKTILGVEYDHFANPSAEVIATARERLAEEDLSSNIAIYVGGLEPIYHVEEMLASVAYLEDWSLVMIGTGSLADRVRKVAAREKAIVYLGTVPHETVPGYLHAADVGLSLVDDPHTLKVLEYGAARLSVVQASGRAEEQFDDHIVFCEPTPEAIAIAISQASGCEGSEAFLEHIKKYDYERVAAEYALALATIV